MPQRTYNLLLGLIVLLALLPRLWLWNDQGRAGMVYPGDQQEYYQGALHILLEGEYYDEGQWLRPPLTSLFLAAIFAVTGISVPKAMLAQCFLSAATLPLLAEIARRLFASWRAGLVAALLAALFLPYASQASQLMSETLFIFMITAALLLFEIAREKGMRWQWLLAGGIVWGLAALTRPVGVYALPLLMGWAVLMKFKQQGNNWGLQRREMPHHTMRDIVRVPLTFIRHPTALLIQPLAILLGFMLVVAPWTARNFMVYNHLVLVDTNGGMSFWLGNLLTPEERELQGVWNRTIPNSAERQQVALQRAMDNIRQEPLLFIARMRYKTVSLWQLDTRLFVANAPIGITLDERSLWFAVASDVEYVVIMLLAVPGVVLARPKERSWTLIGWVLYGTLLSAVSLGHPRLRLPLMMVVFVYAALPLAHPQLLWERLKQSSWLQRSGMLLGWLVFAFLIYAHAYIPFVQSQHWLLRARLGGGEPAIQRAIGAAPDNYLPYVALGDHYREIGLDVLAEDRQRGRDVLTRALHAYDEAATRASQNTYTHARILELHCLLGNTAGAEQARAAIAEVGWDNSQFYAWAKDNLVVGPACYIIE